MRIGLLTAGGLAAVALAACGSPAPPDVPHLGAGTGSAPPTGGGCLTVDQGLGLITAKAGDSGKDLGYRSTCAGATGDDRRNALHAAAECIRRHGVPAYHDPVLLADGHVYTDARSLHEAPGATVAAAATACRAQIVAADLVPDGQAPAPPKLVAAGVKVAQCMRANGLPDYHDPTSRDLFTPGHGFSLRAGDLPGDKTDPTVEHAMQSCEPLLAAEAEASALGNLAE